MKKSATLAVIGGDVRQAYLAGLLHAEGHEVRVFALERHKIDDGIPMHDLRTDLIGVQAVILPMPVQYGDGQLNAPLSNAPHPLADVLDSIPAGTLTLGGAIPFWVHARAVQNELKLLDYLSREELATLNAVPVALAIQTLLRTSTEKAPGTMVPGAFISIGMLKAMLCAVPPILLLTPADYQPSFSAGETALSAPRARGIPQDVLPIHRRFSEWSFFALSPYRSDRF